MLEAEAGRRRRRMLAAWMCMCILWTNCMINCPRPVQKQQQPATESFNVIETEKMQEIAEIPNLVATANVKAFSFEETTYVSHKPRRDDKAKVGHVKEDVENVNDNISYPSADSIVAELNVAEGATIGTYFMERKPAMEYTDEDLYYLANGIYSEAGICSDMECYRVGQVILDRKLDTTGRFPQNTIKEVLYASGQFGCVGGKAWRHGPTDRELAIAKDLLEGARVFPESAVWFNNKHDYGYLYCHPEYHYFSGYEELGVLASQPVTTTEEILEGENELAEETLETVETVEMAEAVEEKFSEEVPEEVEVLAEAQAEAEAEVPPEEVSDEQVEELVQQPVDNYMLARTTTE